MVQTRSQKLKQEHKLREEISEKEKMAVESLILLSEEKNELDNYSHNEINEAKVTLARKYCFTELDKYDLPIPELVKYCPYNGSYENQIKQAIKNKNMVVYHALIKYKNNMEKYTERQNYLKNNFNDILNNVSDDEILTYLKKNSVMIIDNELIMKRILKPDTDCRVYLEDKKNELKILEEMKNLKDQIRVRKEILDITNTELKKIEIKYEDKMLHYKRKYNQ